MLTHTHLYADTYMLFADYGGLCPANSRLGLGLKDEWTRRGVAIRGCPLIRLEEAQEEEPEELYCCTVGCRAQQGEGEEGRG